MPVSARLLAVWCAAVFASACSTTVTGAAVRSAPGIDDGSLSPVDVDAIMLDQSQMRAITGAGDDLSIIPSMDGKIPVDIDTLAGNVPAQCRWVFEESQTFSRDFEEFHKTTFQHPAEAGLISEGAAAYGDPGAARVAFDDLAAKVNDCASAPSGAALIGDSAATSDAIQTRLGVCGRDYRLKSVVLVEVTFCQFPESVPDIVLTNILAKVPG